jgi:hypothetical protein
MGRNRRDELDQVLADGAEPLAGVLVAMRAAVDATDVPAPAPALASFFTSGRPEHLPTVDAAVPAPARTTRRRHVAAAAGIGLALFAGTGVAGALPEPAQGAFDRVADVVGVERRPAPPAVEQPEVPAAETAPDQQGTPVGPELPALPAPAPIDEPPADPVGPSTSSPVVQDRRPETVPAPGQPAEPAGPVAERRPDAVPAPTSGQPPAGDPGARSPESGPAAAASTPAGGAAEPDPPPNRP